MGYYTVAADSAKDFFISYNKADLAWAEWIAWTLEGAGMTTHLQAWDFRPGANFVLAMHEALQMCERTIIVLSPFYLAHAPYSAAEWAASFVQDPTGIKKTLLPVRVHDCEPAGLLATVVYIDIVGCDAVSATDKLLAGIDSEFVNINGIYAANAKSDSSSGENLTPPNADPRSELLER